MMQSSAYMLMFNLKKHERFCVLVNGYIVFMTCMSINWLSTDGYSFLLDVCLQLTNWLFTDE